MRLEGVVREGRVVRLSRLDSPRSIVRQVGSVRRCVLAAVVLILLTPAPINLLACSYFCLSTVVAAADLLTSS